MKLKKLKNKKLTIPKLKLSMRIILYIEKNYFINRLLKDYRYRTIFFTYSSFTFNLFFALSNGIYGLVNHSWWFGTLSAYYILLSIMRFGILKVEYENNKKEKTLETKQNELRIYKRSGVLFILLTIALIGSVILMVCKDNGKSYPGTLIFAVAAYTFYKIIVSVINLFKSRKICSPLVLTIQNIGYTDSLVSLVSLQTAMFVSFGKENNLNPHFMNAITGGTVCIMIMVMGIYMICSAIHLEKQLKGC